MKQPGTPRGTPVVARFPLERLAIALAGCALAAPLLIVGLRAVRLPLTVTCLVVAVVLIAAVPRVVRTLPPGLDGVARWRPVAAVLWLLLALGAAVQTARLSTFMLDPEARGYSLFPGRDLQHDHPAEESRRVGPLEMDDFVYPPTLLLWPRLSMAVTADRLRLRALWFALTGLLLAAAYLAAAAWTGGRAGARLALLFPLFWLSLPVQAGLQLGNFHPAMVALSVLAMLAFNRRRDKLGGSLLAVAVAAKLSPAVLLVYLAARGRWRAIAWTAAAGAALVALTLGLFGPALFRAFFHGHLPALISGEAFSSVLGPESMAARPGPVAGNLSPHGLVLKLQQLGLPPLTAELARAVLLTVSVAHLMLMLALAALVARRNQTPLPGRQPDRRTLLLGWLALISLGAFQAPFIPASYGSLSVIWLVLAQAAGTRQPARLAALAGVWAMTWLLPSFLPAGPGMFGYGVLYQLVLAGICLGQLLVPHPVPRLARPPRRFVVNV
jgi:alpha-1,2-mannosyltransferase